jgi:hypothetical protein
VLKDQKDLKDLLDLQLDPPVLRELQELQVQQDHKVLKVHLGTWVQ